MRKGHEYGIIVNRDLENGEVTGIFVAIHNQFISQFLLPSVLYSNSKY